MCAKIPTRKKAAAPKQVSLGKVASPYLSETEKSLNRALKPAEKKPAVLLFDEANALFGKRTEVKDAHDRYANQEVSYLRKKKKPGKG